MGQMRRRISTKCPFRSDSGRRQSSSGHPVSISSDCHPMYLLLCVPSQLSALDPVSNLDQMALLSNLDFSVPQRPSGHPKT